MNHFMKSVVLNSQTCSKQFSDQKCLPLNENWRLQYSKTYRRKLVRIFFQHLERCNESEVHLCSLGGPGGRSPGDFRPFAEDGRLSSVSLKHLAARFHLSCLKLIKSKIVPVIVSVKYWKYITIFVIPLTTINPVVSNRAHSVSHFFFYVVKRASSRQQSSCTGNINS